MSSSSEYHDMAEFFTKSNVIEKIVSKTFKTISIKGAVSPYK